LRSLETIDPSNYRLKREVSVLHYKNQRGLEVSINNNLGVVTIEDKVVGIEYNPINSEITMFYTSINPNIITSDRPTILTKKQFTLNEGSNLKAIFERDSSPTEL